MKIPPFKLEEFWKKYEFVTPHLLCCSDAESWRMDEVLELADEESKKLWDSLDLSYTEPPGHPLLRQEIARLYTSIASHQVFTFAGAEEGIYCALNTLIEPGDHVVMISPCYQSLATLPETLGAAISSIVLNAEKQWQLGVEEVEEAFRDNTKLVILNYPHNPTGTLLEKKVYERIIELARERHAYIFCDEVYRYLEIDETMRLPSIADAYEKGIALNVMTKAFGLAGLRIGWLATQDSEFLQKAGSYKLYTSICNSAPSEILALIALRAKERILDRNREVMLCNLKILDSFMHRHQNKFSWVRPQSGMMAVIKLLLPISVEQFAEELIERKGVLVMPGSVFDLPGNYFRVGFGKSDMIEGLELLEEMLS